MVTLFEAPIQPSFHPVILGSRRSRRFHDRFRSSQPSDRLFLAAVPDQETAARMADVARRLRSGHGLRGRTLRPENFHVSLFRVGEGVGRRPQSLEAVKERVASVAMPSFKVAFDRAGSFDNGAFALRGGDGMIGLEVLHQRIEDAFDGTPHPARSFTPHVTLLRDRQRIEEQFIEPIEWQVREVVLAHRAPGRTGHRYLSRFPLN